MRQKKPYNSRNAEKFVIRLPEGMREQLATRAAEDDRSMNSTIIQALKKYLADALEPSAIAEQALRKTKA